MKWKRILSLLNSMDFEKDKEVLSKLPNISNPPIINS